MCPSKLVAELEHGLEESQNQRDARVEQLWAKLDPGRAGELDLKALQKGFCKIDHRTGTPAPSRYPISMLTRLCSDEECGRHAEEDSEGGGHERGRQDPI